MICGKQIAVMGRIWVLGDFLKIVAKYTECKTYINHLKCTVQWH